MSCHLLMGSPVLHIAIRCYFGAQPSKLQDLFPWGKKESSCPLHNKKRYFWVTSTGWWSFMSFIRLLNWSLTLLAPNQGRNHWERKKRKESSTSCCNPVLVKDCWSFSKVIFLSTWWKSLELDNEDRRLRLQQQQRQRHRGPRWTTWLKRPQLLPCPLHLPLTSPRSLSWCWSISLQAKIIKIIIRPSVIFGQPSNPQIGRQKNLCPSDMGKTGKTFYFCII